MIKKKFYRGNDQRLKNNPVHITSEDIKKIFDNIVNYFVNFNKPILAVVSKNIIKYFLSCNKLSLLLFH